VAPALRGGVGRRLTEAQPLLDESWAIAQDRGRVDRGRLLGAGPALGDPSACWLDAMFAALLLALVWALLRDGSARAAALAGGAIALASSTAGRRSSRA
jgi:predicted branched-subunit amino acid permease